MEAGLIWIELAEVLFATASRNDALLRAEVRRTLGLVHRQAGNYDDSIRVGREAVAAFEAELGSVHPKSVDARRILARTLNNAGRQDEAIALLLDAVKDAGGTLGTSHPVVAQTQGEIGMIYLGLGDAVRALEHLEPAVASLEATLGVEHFFTALHHGHLSGAYSLLDDTERALRYAKLGAAGVVRMYGDAPGSLGALVELAATYDRNEQVEEAAAVYERVSAILDAGGVEPNPAVVAYGNIGRFWDRGYDYEKAMLAFEAAQDILRTELAPDHPDNHYIAINISISMWRQKRYAEVLEYAKPALEFYRNSPDGGGAFTMSAMEMVGRGHRGLGEFDEALAHFRAALELRIAQLGPDHVQVTEALQRIKELCTEDHYAPACEYTPPT